MDIMGIPQTPWDKKKYDSFLLIILFAYKIDSLRKKNTSNCSHCHSRSRITWSALDTLLRNLFPSSTTQFKWSENMEPTSITIFQVSRIACNYLVNKQHCISKELCRKSDVPQSTWYSCSSAPPKERIAGCLPKELLISINLHFCAYIHGLVAIRIYCTWRHLWVGNSSFAQHLSIWATMLWDTGIRGEVYVNLSVVFFFLLFLACLHDQSYTDYILFGYVEWRLSIFKSTLPMINYILHGSRSRN